RVDAYHFLYRLNEFLLEEKEALPVTQASPLCATGAEKEQVLAGRNAHGLPLPWILVWKPGPHRAGRFYFSGNFESDLGDSKWISLCGLTTKMPVPLLSSGSHGHKQQKGGLQRRSKCLCKAGR
ncbi:hypothetical protein H1C71_042003, partial [Ictidomys tridecemlineatus]